MTTAVRPMAGAMPLRAGCLAAARLQQSAGVGGVVPALACRPATATAFGAALPRRNRCV